jgi:glucans biosynthesis protein C
MSKQSNERYYYLDTLRSFLIFLVVFMHSSQIFNPDQTWLLYSENNNVVVKYIVDFTNLLRMPSLFIVTGFFTVISFRHRNSDFFLTKRIFRLLIPLVVIAITFNSIQAYLLHSFEWKNYKLQTYFLNGDWIQHLWFLINLIIYTLISYLCIKFFKNSIVNKIKIIASKFNNISIYYLLFIFPIFSIIMLVIMKLIPTFVFGININSILNYMPYFFLGVLLCLNKNLLVKISNVPLIYSFTIVIIFYFLSIMIIEQEHLLFRVLYFYLKGIAIYFIACFTFSFFKKFLDFKMEFISKLNNSSYSIYLLHHLFVLTIGLYVIQLDINFTLGIPLIFFISILLSYTIHRRVIMNSKIMLFLINGQKTKKQ